MAPEVRLYIPPGEIGKFKDAVPSYKGRLIAAAPVPEDYQDEIFETYNDFMDKLTTLGNPHPDPKTETKIIEAYRGLIPNLSNRDVFRAGETSKVKTESIIELRTALVDDFKQSLNPEPTKIENNDVMHSIGASQIEMILLLFGLESGEPMTTAKVGKELGYTAAKITRDVESYFDKIRRQTRRPKQHRGEVSRVIFKIASQLT